MNLLGVLEGILFVVGDEGITLNQICEILSIDIADIDVGINIGAQLQADQAEADKKIAQAKAEERRAMAVALEQEKLAYQKAKIDLAKEYQILLEDKEQFKKDQERFLEYQHQIKINAAELAKQLSARGYRLVAGGTDCHVMCLDLRSKNMTGKTAEAALDKAGITANKNTIPFDPEKPFVTSGLRLGTAAVTTRGMKEKDMQTVADLIDQALSHAEDEGYLAQIAQQVKTFLGRFPLYEDLK